MTVRWLLLSKRMVISTVITIFLLIFSTVAFAGGFLVKAGMRGENVRRVQVLLIDQGYLAGDADGICGNMTVEAIKQFQRASGLDDDGICGSITYERLSRGRKHRTVEGSVLSMYRRRLIVHLIPATQPIPPAEQRYVMVSLRWTLGSFRWERMSLFPGMERL